MYMQKRTDALYRSSKQHISVPDMADQNLLKKDIRNSRRKILFGTAVIALAVLCIAACNVLFDSSIRAFSRMQAGASHAPAVENAVFARYRETASIQLAYKGSKPMTVSTETVTVGELLDSLGIVYDDDDLLSHPVDAVVEENMLLSLDEVTFTTTTEDSALAYEVVKKNVDTIKKGTTQVIRKGENGLARKTFRNRLVNGELESAVLLSEETVTQPINEIVQVGVGGVYTAADGKSYKYSHYLDVTATAYGKNDGASGDFTYTGARATRGVIAVDPNVIPLRTKVYVVGDYGDYGVNSAEDIGGGIKGNRIDICMDCSLEEMLRFGRRQMRVYILEE